MKKSFAQLGMIIGVPVIGYDGLDRFGSRLCAEDRNSRCHQMQVVWR
jgi:hypothetical protein